MEETISRGEYSEARVLGNEAIAGSILPPLSKFFEMVFCFVLYY